jgi:hypothetical protein
MGAQALNETRAPAQTDNGHAERTASSKRYLSNNPPDVVRTLRDPFHQLTAKA